MSENVPDKAKLIKLARFDRKFFDSSERFTIIGNGGLGGKASGLLSIRDLLTESVEADKFPGITVDIPTLTVITTDLFDKFMERNKLHDVVMANKKRDDQIALAFQQADLPVEIVGDLRALVMKFKQPLAVRSSSMLEDAMFEPFAGVYATKMIPNNQFSVDQRFRALVEAIKFVYASTFFRGARNYLRATGRRWTDEKMAVIIQEVIGSRFGERFYPQLSGVARSYNFYPTGHAKPDDGVVSLALGLGKTIVDGGVSWAYSPSYPKADPPYGNVGELLKSTQTKFWAVNLGKPPAHDPIKETEFLISANLADAENDGTLRHLASTYDSRADRIYTGTGAKGPRVLNFAPILRAGEMPLNDLLKELQRKSEDAYKSSVEIEFAMKLHPEKCTPARFGFLQVRPMFVSDARVDVSEEELHSERAVVASDRVLGNGVCNDVRDIVFVKRDTFDAAKTREIGRELMHLNQSLTDADKPFLLIVFGRLGTSDPWLGIPVEWSDVSGAKVIVETSIEKMNVDLSQGSHFFHNVTSLRIFYFSAGRSDQYPMKWDWLESLSPAADLNYVRHVSLEDPLLVKVDGKSGRGVVIS